MLTVRYTNWDGTQRVRLEAGRVFEKLAEYLSYTDDVQPALDWLMRHGAAWEGMRVMGSDDLPDELREKMRKHYREVNLNHAFDELNQRLNDLLEDERDVLDERAKEQPGPQNKRDFLEQLPRRLAEALEQLRNYDFEDNDARN